MEVCKSLWLLERGFQEQWAAAWSWGNAGALVWGRVNRQPGRHSSAALLVILSRSEALKTFYVKSKTGCFKDRKDFTEHGFCGYLIQDRI